MTEERRQLRRQQFQLAVRVRLDSIDQLINEYARDLSLGGMSLRLNTLAEIGEKIYLEFSLRDGDPEISVFAQVKWVKAHDHGCYAGVEFLDLDEQGREFIRQVLIYIDERRLHRRVQGRHSVEIKTKSIEEFAEVYADDISSGGTRLHVNRPLKVGGALTIHFKLPAGKDLIAADGIVRWCEPREFGFAVGVEFADLSAHAKRFVADVIEFGKKPPAKE